MAKARGKSTRNSAEDASKTPPEFGLYFLGYLEKKDPLWLCLWTLPTHVPDSARSTRCGPVTFPSALCGYVLWSRDMCPTVPALQVVALLC